MRGLFSDIGLAVLHLPSLHRFSVTQPGREPRLGAFSLPRPHLVPKAHTGGWEGMPALCGWASFARLPPKHPPLNSEVMTGPEPLIWELLLHAQALGHLSPVFLSEITFILGLRTAETRATWPLSALLGQHLPLCPLKPQVLRPRAGSEESWVMLQHSGLSSP